MRRKNDKQRESPLGEVEESINRCMDAKALQEDLHI